MPSRDSLPCRLVVSQVMSSSHPSYYIVQMSSIKLGSKDIAEYSDGHSAGDMQKVYTEGFGCALVTRLG